MRYNEDLRDVNGVLLSNVVGEDDHQHTIPILNERAELLNQRMDELQYGEAPMIIEEHDDFSFSSTWVVWVAFFAGFLLACSIGLGMHLVMGRPAPPEQVALDPQPVEVPQEQDEEHAELLERVSKLERRLDYVRVEQLRADCDMNTDWILQFDD